MTTAANVRPKVALLPLDDRPVNVRLPRDVAQVAGFELEVPPVHLLPDYRRPGDVAGLGSWLLERARDPAVEHLVVSLDMLCFGGLIASRTSGDTTADALRQLDVLRQIRRDRPALAISAVSLVMRASNSNSAAEEPDYWATHGRELHDLGGRVHRLDTTSGSTALGDLTDVPALVVSDYVTRRLRNHIVNLTALTLVEDGTLDLLTVTADDTAVFSAGSAEQEWLRHWTTFLPTGHTVLMYPGADEVGAALVARAVSALSGVRPTVRVTCPEIGGLDRVPPFENTPLTQSVGRQIVAAGAAVGEVGSPADVVLVIHPPDRDRHDMIRGYADREDPAAVSATVETVRTELAAGNRVALADVRYPNGADPGLVAGLAADGLLGDLTAFGGWNTAGNTLGGVIATSVAAVVGSRTGRGSATALRQALLVRLLDDWAYQCVIRSEDAARLFPDRLPMSDGDRVRRAEAHIGTRLREVLDRQLPGAGWQLDGLTLPWRRSFEVGITLRPPDSEIAGD